jgi:beta-glucosidase
VQLASTSDVTHPSLLLRAFRKAKDLQPGQGEKVNLKLDKHTVSFWEENLRSISEMSRRCQGCDDR